MLSKHPGIENGAYNITASTEQGNFKKIRCNGNFLYEYVIRSQLIPK